MCKWDGMGGMEWDGWGMVWDGQWMVKGWLGDGMEWYGMIGGWLLDGLGWLGDSMG